MPKFKQFDGFQVNVYSADHNPPHFHVLGPTGREPDFEALIDIRTLQIIESDGIPRKVLAEVIAWAAANVDALYAEWRRLNERD